MRREGKRKRKLEGKPDGTRRRRFSFNKAKREWYAKWRAIRFTKRFGFAAAAA